ncbi:hypothetical protein [Aequorivita lipolytica]|jgi:hypothetical protein|uniref:Addiction module protein n=1 Tax=Aequorivita lipolytica TaxID=153267 RepID=A0A5C6YSF0_9FLAO|nr:hypothetical protein [Aequorivita lipolytica]TXD70334.1 hypothetical protein ESV24_03985 [Aequorivita lipolytica]SRX50763.1 hypothetical protein AEQU2_01239 [Aequorivita lipolytica]
MATTNYTVEQLAQAFQELSISERTKLAALLPEKWFEDSNELTEIQKQALDFASEKENDGRAVFHTWEEVENYVKHRPNE